MNVIVPDGQLKVNEVDLSYNTFRIIFRNMIIFTLMKMDGLTLATAYHKWAESINFSSKIYSVMEYIREKMKPMVLLNRNPTLNYYSMVLMKIRKVIPDAESFTLHVPLYILPGQYGGPSSLISGNAVCLTPV